MKKIESLKLIITLSVGLACLAIIVLSYWSYKIDGNYTGKNPLLLRPSRIQTERILISISVEFSEIYCRFQIIHFVLRFHRPRSAISPHLLSLHRPFRLHHFESYSN